MKTSIIGLFIFTISVKWSLGQNFEAEQEIMNLSKEKWLWMSDKNADKLDTLSTQRQCLTKWVDRGEKNKVVVISTG
jgi:hypothetical protein